MRILTALILAALVLAVVGCGENAPIVVKRVDADHFLIWDRDGWSPESALSRTCPSIGRPILYYVVPVKHQHDALAVVCGQERVR
jgi:hypothetical protein